MQTKEGGAGVGQKKGLNVKKSSVIGEVRHYVRPCWLGAVSGGVAIF